MNKVKLKLEDGREFEVGEEVEINPTGLRWTRAIVGILSGRYKIGFAVITQNPHIIRKLPARKTVPLTNDDVLEMLRKGWYEWKLKTGVWVGCPSYNVKGNLVNIAGRFIDGYTAYRHVSDLIEHPLTKEVEG